MSRYDRLLVCLVILMMILMNAVAIVAPAESVASRTGSMGNEPAGGYTEYNDTFRIFHQDGTNDTVFAIGETVYVNISTDRVADGSINNVLRVLDYLGNPIVDLDPAFTQTDGAAPGYSYEASFVLAGASFNADHYRLEVELDDGNNVFSTADTLIVGGGANPSKHIRTFSDDTFQTESHIFGPNDIIYVEVYSGGLNKRNRDCDIDFENYQNDRDRNSFNQLSNSTTSTNGNYVWIAYDLSNDLNKNAVGFTSGWWYTITVTMLTPQGADIIVDWVVQIYIMDAPVVSNVEANPASVNRIGADSTTIFSEFSDVDAAGPGDFTVTFQVREPDDATVIILVDAQTDGNGGLVVTDLGNGDYNASYVWDPPGTATIGLYDLYVNVTDTTGLGDISGFGANQDELDVFDASINPPVVTSGNVSADPAIIPRPGTAITTISANFSDPDDHANDQFQVSFKVRDANGVEIVLADMAADGDQGLGGATVSVVKHPGSVGNYTASFDWDPNDTVALGLYDLYFNVTDPTSQLAEDIFANNQDELELTDGTTPPVIHNVTAVPAQMDKIGNGQTVIGVEFSDMDGHLMADYNVSLAIRDPNGTVIDIAIDVGQGGTGEFGETLTIATAPGQGFVASMPWDPPDSALVGLYDLRASVTDPSNTTATSDFDANLDELNVTTSDLPPEMDAGDLTAIPDVVPRLTPAFTRLEARFTDEDNTDPAIYNVSFKVRDSGNAEYVLVNDKGNGGAGEFGGTVEIRRTGNHFVASYDWDPPDDQPLGMYDLYFWLSDGNVFIEDAFGDNMDELEIVDVPTPLALVIGATYADPDTVNRNGTSHTTLITNFTDPDVNATNVTAFQVTFRIRSPTGNQITLADAKRSGEVGEGGGMVTVENVTGGWQARVTWDPPSDTELGTYDLFAQINDPVDQVADGFGANLEELTIVDEAIADVKDVKADPASIFAANDNTTVILVEFMDPAEAAISNFTVTVKVRDPAGNETVLVDAKASGAGGLTVNKAGTNYTASYTWDPAADMALGKYDLYAMVVTAAGWSDESGFGANPDELELLELPIVGKPTLTDEDVDKDGKNYRFSVIYRNSENIAPDANGVVLRIAGQTYKMIETDPTNLNYTKGKEYYFILELGKGEQLYHFEVTDQTGQKASTAEQTIKVKKDDGKEDDMSAVIGGIIGFLIVILVVILIFFLLSRGEKKDKDMGGEGGAESGESEEDVPHVEAVPVAKVVEEDAPPEDIKVAKEAKVEPIKPANVEKKEPVTQPAEPPKPQK